MTDALAKVGIVIPVHNRREITLQGLRSLARIDTAGLDVRTFIVDDGSTDGTSDAIRSEFPEVELIAGDGTLHYAAGTNRGIEAAMAWGCDFVAAMNDDAVFHEQFLRRMINAAKATPRSVIGGLLLLWDEPHRVFQVGQTWHTLSGGWEIPGDLTAFTVGGVAFEVECLVGNCVLIPADAIRECGILDEKRFPYGWGDAQYMARLRKAGWNLLVEPRAYVWCEPNTYPAPLHRLSIRKRADILFRDERNPLNLKRQFVLRWESAPSRFAAVAAFLVYCLKIGLKAAGLRPFEQRPGDVAGPS
jgi:GT2 family glycosyltransferase